MPVGEMLSRISSIELTEWIAEFKIRADESEAAEKEAAGKPTSKGKRVPRS